MVQIGTIEYEARVTGVGEAKQNAEDFASTQEDVAQSSEKAATSGGFLAGTLGFLASREEEAGQQADRTNTKVDVLSSGLWFLGSTAVTTAAEVLGLTGAFGAVSGAVGTVTGALEGLTLAGVLGSVTGAIEGFAGWLAAGSAGALAFAGAIGFGLGVLGVWILQVTGALDAVRGFGQFVRKSLPGWVRDGLLQMISLAAGPLAAFGAFITGTLEGGFDEGFARAKKVIQIFAGAWDRNLDRLASGAVGLKNRVVGTFNDLKNGAIGTFNDLGNAAAGQVRSAWNNAIPARLEFPSVTIGKGVPGPDYTIGGYGISLPRMATGGMVQESGVAVVHKGESVIPEPLTSAAKSSSTGGGGGGGDTTIQSLTINLSGDFDPSDMSRRDLERLAERVNAAIGKKTNTRAGVR